MLRQFYTIDTDGRRFLSPTQEALDVSAIRWMRGDKFVLCLSLVRRDQTGAFVAYELASGDSLKFCIKLTSERAAATPLAFSDVDQFNVPGDWSSISTSAHSCRVDLNTSGINALMTTAVEDLTTLRAELILVDASGIESTLAQQAFTIIGDLYRGNEGAAAAGTPTYYTAAQVDAMFSTFIRRAPNGDLWAVKNGEPVANLTGVGAWQ